MADAIEGSGLLSSHRIHSLPPSFYYVPNFISVKEETRLLEQVHDSLNLVQLLLPSQPLTLL